MTRAAAAEPTAARRLLLFGLRFQRRGATISGHARLLAYPAYQKLLAAEPLLRRLIPVLIFIFLVIVGLARFIELYQLRAEREYQARESMSMIASVLADGSRALATVDNLDSAFGSVALVEPLANVYDNWRADVSLNVSIFIGTSAILLVILYAYFSQSTRAVEADRIYTETQARFET